MPHKKCASGKISHPTEAGARAAIARQKKGGIMNAYGCKRCGGWHLGRSSNAARNANWIGTLLARHEKQLKKRNGL